MMARSCSLKSALLLAVVSAVVTLYGCCKEFQSLKLHRNSLSESGSKVFSFQTNALRSEGDRSNVGKWLKDFSILFSVDSKTIDRNRTIRHERSIIQLGILLHGYKLKDNFVHVWVYFLSKTKTELGDMSFLQLLHSASLYRADGFYCMNFITVLLLYLIDFRFYARIL